MQRIAIDWQGEEIEFTPSFDLFMRIEEKVSFARIADAMTQAGLGKPAELPLSHVAWVVYCCLREAGAAVRTPLDAHQAVVGGSVKYGSVIGALIVAYYTASPQKIIKKNDLTALPPNPSRPSSRKSKSATA